MSSCSTGQTPAVCSLPPHLHPPPSSTSLPQMIDMLDSAAEQMMVHGDFHAAFDTCQRGLENLASGEPEVSRSGELKAGFCILGIQALAEMNQWSGVLCWVLQQFGHQEDIPAKIMQMCILLYSKVGEPSVMHETARVWLHSPLKSRVSGFRTVAELYLLHVLVPLGHLEEAKDFIEGELGGAAFLDQRQTALDIVQKKNQESSPNPSPDSGNAAHPVSIQGAVVHKLESILRFLYRKLLLSGSGSFSLRKFFLAAVLLYMLLLRVDPAHPSSFMWISKLLQLLKQMWRAMFAPYYQAPI